MAAHIRVGLVKWLHSLVGADRDDATQLPAVDEDVTAGESLGEVESTKSVSDIFAPFTAKVLAANGELDGQPDLVNTDPYDTGWLVELEVADEATLDAALAATLDAEAYKGLTSE